MLVDSGMIRLEIIDKDETHVRTADAIMVARGDLGIEIEYYKLPLVQRDLVRTCQNEGKPVIIAIQLLESMISSPMHSQVPKSSTRFNCGRSNEFEEVRRVSTLFKPGLLKICYRGK